MYSIGQKVQIVGRRCVCVCVCVCACAAISTFNWNCFNYSRRNAWNPDLSKGPHMIQFWKCAVFREAWSKQTNKQKPFLKYLKLPSLYAWETLQYHLMKFPSSFQHSLSTLQTQSLQVFSLSFALSLMGEKRWRPLDYRAVTWLGYGGGCVCMYVWEREAETEYSPREFLLN